jgi:citrate lyase subunit beta/citryl-CoA lyase
MGLRRSLLFIPGNSPGMLLNGAVFGADCVIYDLEDAVPLNEKDSARILVRNVLSALDEIVERIVRINSIQTPFWKSDLDMIIPHKPEAILLPKTQGKEDVQEVDDYLLDIEKKERLVPGLIKIIPLIETALGVEKAFEIAKASPRVDMLFLGAEDLTADLGAKRTKKGDEILYSRSRIIVAAKASGIAAIDTPFTDVNDEEGLIKDATFARELGFNGKAVISPRHIEDVNRIFSPSEEEISYAKRVVEASERAQKDGKGVVSLDGKMIDAPIVVRAKQVLKMADRIKGDVIK